VPNDLENSPLSRKDLANIGTSSADFVLILSRGVSVSGDFGVPLEIISSQEAPPPSPGNVFNLVELRLGILVYFVFWCDPNHAGAEGDYFVWNLNGFGK